MRPQHVWERGTERRGEAVGLSRNFEQEHGSLLTRIETLSKTTAEHYGIYSISGECGVKAAPPLYNTVLPALTLI